MRLDANKAIHSTSHCRRRVNLSYPGQGSSLQTIQPRTKRRDALICALTSTASLPQMLAKTHRFTASDISNSEGLQYGAMPCSTISTTEGLSLLHQAVKKKKKKVRGQRHAPAAFYPVPIVQEAGWAWPVWTGAENLVPTWIRCRDRPARSQSLYRLRYPAHTSGCKLRTKCHGVLVVTIQLVYRFWKWIGSTFLSLIFHVCGVNS